MFFDSHERKFSFGLLIMRVGLAAVLLIHSLPKLFGGSLMWKTVGTSFSYINFGLPVEIFGFSLLLLEGLGGISLLCGYLFKTFCILMLILFISFEYNYLKIGYHNMAIFILGLISVFLGFLNTGPGRYAIAVKLEKK